MTIKKYLVKLIIWCVGPLILLALILSVVQVRMIQTRQKVEAQDHVKNLSAAIDHNIAARITALQSLAACPLIDDMSRLEEFYKESHGFRNYQGGHVILADPQTQMLFNTRVPYGRPLPKLPVPKGHAAAAIVLKERKPEVGDMFFGPIAQEPLVAVVVPVVRNGRLKALLLNIIETNQYKRMLDNLSLPDGWSTVLFDGKGEIMAQRGKPEKRLKESGRVFDSKLKTAPWRVSLTVPYKLYYAPFATAAILLALILLAVSLAAILAGRLFGKKIATAVASLADDSAFMNRPLIFEIENVRSLLRKAGLATEFSENELRKSEERYRTFFGTIGLFLTLMFLFVRVLPMISIFEMRTLLPEASPKHKTEGGAH